MKNHCLKTLLIAVSVFLGIPLIAQIPIHDPGIQVDESRFFTNNAKNPCVTETLYKIIEQRCMENNQRLQSEKKTQTGVVSLEWPLRAADRLTDCSFYRVSAYVDQNTTSGAFQDFNCGTNTYDGHRGTDISIWPYNYLKMDSNWVEVIAAAPGMIIDKHDGEFDKNCATNTMMPNYIVVQHTDGSKALYLHMKKNSLTAKTIGQSLKLGEFIGIVGSSGNSSGPHLHFEVWAGATVATRIDPFKGSCNALNTTSWWAKQNDYKETAIVKVSSNSTDIVIPACPATEIPNETNVFQIPFQGSGLPAGFAKFYIFLRDERSGMTADISILNPDGSVFTSWTYTSPADSKTRIQGWSKKLPTNPGKYTFKAIYNGKTCVSQFEITLPVQTKTEKVNSDFIIYPNPTNGQFTIQLGEACDGTLKISTMLGTTVYTERISQRRTELNIPVRNGIYYYEFQNDNGQKQSGKIQIEN
ncbi:MAG: peptidoglycan DD-metalloendopeptidase family protein [Saprospiraceae bacterium]